MIIFGNKLGLLTKRVSVISQRNSLLFLRKNKIFAFSTKNEKEEDAKKSGNNDDKDNDGEDSNSLLTISTARLLAMKKEIEAKIVDGELNLDFVPSPNYFGEIPIFITPNDAFSKRMNNELSGLGLLSSITILNYLGLLYSSSFFYYFAFLTFSSAFKIVTGSGMNNQIVLMTLIDDKNVRIVYLSGIEEVVPIKSIVYNPEDRFNSILFEKDDTRKQKSKMSNLPRDSSRMENRRMAVVSLIVENKRKNLILRNNILGNRGNVVDSLAFADLTLFLGIVNKKTKKIKFTVSSKNEETTK